MAIRIVRLGTPRAAGEGLRLGTVRRPPRGVRKEDYGRLDYYDLWLPDLAPSAETVHFIQSEPLTPKRWDAFVKRYRREMREPAAERLLALLAALSHQTNVAVGCYCEDADHCHRSILRDLLVEHGAVIEGV
jgi:uncharacterized protein YeaO (DUF488 family)